MVELTSPRRLRETFVTESIRERLAAVGLKGFEGLWTHEAEWVEAPNFRRRGWSGVCRLELNLAEGPPLGLYIKRQENHVYRSLRSPFRLQPTALREYRCLVAMKAAAIATPEVLYYGERRRENALQAILMTREVPRNIPLDDFLRMARQRPTAEVRHVLAETAALISRLHRSRFLHGALYGKHVLISGFDREHPAAPGKTKLFPVLIDVEKARRRPSRTAIALKDLEQFYRRTPWPAPLWDVFLDHYLAAARMPWLKPFVARRIARRRRVACDRQRAGTQVDRNLGRHGESDLPSRTPTPSNEC